MILRGTLVLPAHEATLIHNLSLPHPERAVLWFSTESYVRHSEGAASLRGNLDKNRLTFTRYAIASATDIAWPITWEIKIYEY